MFVALRDSRFALPFLRPVRPRSQEKFEQRLRDILGSPSTIFAHPDERGPVLRTEHGPKSETGGEEASVVVNKGIKVRQAGVERVADAFETVEGNLAHHREPANCSGFHINESSLVGR